MEQQKQPKWEALLWGVVIAGCYERRKNQCELPIDEYLIEQWEKVQKESHAPDCT